jgi:hypothetical protein
MDTALYLTVKKGPVNWNFGWSVIGAHTAIYDKRQVIAHADTAEVSNRRSKPTRSLNVKGAGDDDIYPELFAKRKKDPKAAAST